MTAVAPPRALYVHFPWCARKCPYCDFNSHAISNSHGISNSQAIGAQGAGNELPETQYLDCLEDDLNRELRDQRTLRLESVFLGGGTPSLISPAAIGRLLEGVQRQLPLPDEITLEANPGTVDEGNFRGYRAAGVSRISIGVQSFADRNLAALGRIHDGERARRAIGAASSAGFDNVNVDLMYGLPGQLAAGALSDLATAVALGVPHVSWYQLTIEPNTAFHRRPPALPDEDTIAAIEAAGAELLQAAGFERYEVSAWSRAGARARHNVNYWRFGDYLGIGAGAHGKVTTVDGGVLSILRYQKSRAPAHYMADVARRQTAAVAPAARPLEFMLNALRLVDGVEEELFATRTGVPLTAVASIIAGLRRQRLLRERRLATTPLGLRFLNSVVAAFDAPVAEVAHDIPES